MYGRFRSYSALARATDINKTLLSQKLNGQRPWYLHEVQAIAKALGTTMAYLTGEASVAEPTNGSGPVSEETGPGLVAGAGFEPTTSGL